MEGELSWLIREGEQWVRAERNRHRPRGIAIGGPARQVLTSFFTPETLDLVRVASVTRIENPGFYAAIEERGEPIPIDFRPMAGITFIDTVLLAEDAMARTFQPLISLLTHELIHVVQYSLLGVDAFIDRYVRGWADNGKVYEKIPLERDAIDLQTRFDSALGRPFSMEQAVGATVGSPEMRHAARV
jgi:hypothetical protein